MRSVSVSANAHVQLRANQKSAIAANYNSSTVSRNASVASRLIMCRRHCLFETLDEIFRFGIRASHSVVVDPVN